VKTQIKATKTIKPAIVATRKSCKADGIGLSHYVMLDSKNK
jgi:modified peptide precursor CbpA